MKQAVDNVSPLNLSLVMKEMSVAPILARAILREQNGGKNDMKQGSLEYPLTNPSNKEGRRVRDDEECLQDNAKRMENLWMGIKIRGSGNEQKEGRVSHMIFADKCCLFAETKVQTLKKLGDATTNLEKRGLD